MINASNQSEGVSVGDRIKALAKLSIDKLPMLNVVVERMGAGCVDAFHAYCPPSFSAFVNQIVAGDSWDLLEALSDSIAVVFYCREWDSRLVIGLERRLVFAIEEAMFGGKAPNLLSKRPGRLPFWKCGSEGSFASSRRQRWKKRSLAFAKSRSSRSGPEQRWNFDLRAKPA